MDIETSKDQLKTAVEILQAEHRSIDDAFEKLVVATTNVFRLVDGQSKTLLTLQGSPKEIQGYVLGLILEIRKMTSTSTEQVITNLMKVIEHLDAEQMK